jgi:phage/plasmid-associated DNA primase
VSEEDAVNIMLEALSRQLAAADDKAEEVYAVDTARAIFRDAERVADEDEQKKIVEWAIRSQSLERLKAMWTLAKADLAVSPEELDTDPMLLNVENGTLERVMNSIRNGIGMRETEIAKEPSRPWNPHSYAVFAQVHNTL